MDNKIQECQDCIHLMLEFYCREEEIPDYLKEEFATYDKETKEMAYLKMNKEAVEQ